MRSIDSFGAHRHALHRKEIFWNRGVNPQTADRRGPETFHQVHLFMAGCKPLDAVIEPILWPPFSGSNFRCTAIDRQVNNDTRFFCQGIHLSQPPQDVFFMEHHDETLSLEPTIARFRPHLYGAGKVGASRIGLCARPSPEQADGCAKPDVQRRQQGRRWRDHRLLRAAPPATWHCAQFHRVQHRTRPKIPVESCPPRQAHGPTEATSLSECGRRPAACAAIDGFAFMGLSNSAE